jgi:hypothetical protein
MFPFADARPAMRSQGGLMLSHRAKVASIVSRRVDLAGVVDLIKPLSRAAPQAVSPCLRLRDLAGQFADREYVWWQRPPRM